VQIICGNSDHLTFTLQTSLWSLSCKYEFKVTQIWRLQPKDCSYFWTCSNVSASHFDDGDDDDDDDNTLRIETVIHGSVENVEMYDMFFLSPFVIVYRKENKFLWSLVLTCYKRSLFFSVSRTLIIVMYKKANEWAFFVWLLIHMPHIEYLHFNLQAGLEADNSISAECFLCEYLFYKSASFQSFPNVETHDLPLFSCSIPSSVRILHIIKLFVFLSFSSHWT
jgi:hypothetical protein